jgi:hypothetical protein
MRQSQIDKLRREMRQDIQTQVRAAETRINTEVKESIDKILLILEPISESYKTASKVGRWAMGLLLFVSIIVGIVVGIVNIFRR